MVASPVSRKVRQNLIAYRRETKTVLYEYFLGKGFAVNESPANMEKLLEETQQLKLRRLELVKDLLPVLERNPHYGKHRAHSPR